jgi:hypothetical protein
MPRSWLFLAPLVWALAATGLHADGPAFDLAGPKVDVHVKRGSMTLPISEAPNLLPGDRLWIHPDLPESQSAHFVLVVAFLRGTTNPPPPEWFTRVETWTREAHDEGVFVTVPAEAQQALLFLAPETGGDFNTLRKAVRAEPGSFVRADQDLQAASWERMRLENYLKDVKITSQTDPALLKKNAEMAARSLGIKINESCFSKPADQQTSCLSQNSEGMVLDDANAQSLVNQLANGSALDLVNQLSSTTFGGGGVYSPYIGAIVDTARILSSLHTAHFQYIPALALPTTDTLNLRLNMPPSFRNPKSVVVIGLPPIGPARPEPLYQVNPEADFCAAKPALVLPAEGAPLVFATQLAHNLFLHIAPQANGDNSSPAGHPVDVSVIADPVRGGLVFAEPAPALPSGPLNAELRGKWGFDDWVGPTFHLYSPEPGKWALAASDQSALVVGRVDTLHLVGQSTQCVQKVQAQIQELKPVTLTWASAKPDTLQFKVPLDKADPGPVELTIAQYGLKEPDRLKMTAYDAEASLQGLTLNAGDKQAILSGTRLDEVAMARLHGIVLTPATLSRVANLDQLVLKAGGSTAGLDPGGDYSAEVELKDGRKLKAPVAVESPRPQIVLLSKGVQANTSNDLPPIQLGSPDDLPVGDRLVFFLKSSTPATFSRSEKVELAAADSSFDTLLDLKDGSLMLEDAKTAEASLEPASRFGSSAFGPVRVRAVAADGEAGDWVPLGTLVRVPGFKELRCPHQLSKPCMLSGSNLFLATLIAATPQFDNATPVPPEFTGTDLIVPHPSNGLLYVKLRDDPATVQTVTLPVTTITLAESKAVAAEAQAPPTEAPPSSATPSAAPETPPSAGGASSEPGAGSPPPETPQSGNASGPSNKSSVDQNGAPVKTTAPAGPQAAVPAPGQSSTAPAAAASASGAGSNAAAPGSSSPAPTQASPSKSD